MPLGVLNNISAVYAENNLNQTQASLQNVLTQLSSGTRINSGADDPAGLSIANGLASNSAALAQSSSNASEGAGFLQVADGALSQVTSLLTSAVTLATEAGGGTLSASQMGAANQEYGDILTQIQTIGGTTEYNGILVFSAASTASTTALSFTGGTNPLATYTGGGVPAAVNPTGAGTLGSPYVFTLTPGDTLSGGFTVSSAGGTNPATTFIDLTNATYAGLSSTNLATESAAATALQAALNGMTATTGSVYSVSDNGGVVSIASNGQGGVAHTEAITITGNNGKQVAPVSTTLSLGTTLTGSLMLNSTGATHNGSQVINFNGNAALAGLTSNSQATETTAAAALQSLLNAGAGNLSTQTGSTYTVTDTLGVLTITSSTGAENLMTAGSTLHEGSAVSVNLQTGDMLSGSISIASTGGSVGSSSQIINLASYSGLASSNAATRAAAVGALQTALNTGNGLAASGSQYTVAVNAGVLTIATNGSDALQVTPTNADESTLVAGGITIYAGDGTTTGSQNYNVTVGALSDTTVGTSAALSSAGTPVVATVGGVTGNGGTTAGAGVGTSLGGTALDNQADAEAALQTVTNAISAVAYQRGQVGANINMLTAASNIASSQMTNITAAENTISATDYAAATSNMSKYEILTQTGISALAQANSTQQMVTKLLQ